MTRNSKTQLLTSSAIVGVAIMQLAPAAQAQENFGIHNQQPELLEVVVNAGEQVEGNSSGVFGDTGPIRVTNSGVIRGNGTYDGFDAVPDGGIVIAVAGSSVTNSGSISGARFGITTVNYFNPATGLLEPRAVGTVVNNLAGGSIIGDTDDGVRLIGGGTVTNAGTIEGRSGTLADGISMFALVGQDTSALSSIGTVDNLAGGTIGGNRFGVILSGGGVINNAGTIFAPDFSGGSLDGLGAGVLFQAGPAEVGKIASLTNSGTISGGNGALFGAFLASSELTNSGTIIGTRGAGVQNSGSSALTINNEIDGDLIGETSGVFVQGGTLDLVNAGRIRGNGVGTALGAFEGGIRLQSGTNTIVNNGSISGAQFGIVTVQARDPQTEALVWRVGATQVVNTGTIQGESSDAILLLGGGSVINSGQVIGGSGIGADGIQLQFYPGQDSGQPQIGTIENRAGGTIVGERYGIILAGGGTITNAGTITGGTNGVALVSQNFSGKTGILDNSGIIEGGVLFDLSVAQLTNSGTISIDSLEQAALVSRGQINVVNTGTISTTGSHAIRFGNFNDQLTLGLGSQILGASDAGGGIDTLVLDSNTIQSQALGLFSNFESLNLISGQWAATGATGNFGSINITGGKLTLTGEMTGSVSIGEFGTFQLGAGGSVGGFTGDIDNDGSMIVDIESNFDITGNFAGSGLFIKQGSGNVSFLGTYDFSGVTRLLAGGIKIAGAINPETVFDLQSGQLDLSESTATAIAGLTGTSNSSVILGVGGNLTVNQAIDTVYAGSISGGGSLIKQGDGRLNLTGINTYTGTTTIESGTLAVNGSITSPVTVKAGGTLGGTGTTGPITVESGGTFAPGNSIGTIAVSGTLRFLNGSNYLVETTASGAADRINVTGNAVIGSGVTVNVFAADGNYRPTTTYVILTASDRISGTFASVGTDLAFLEPKLVHKSRSVELTLKRRDNSFASAATNRNQVAVASAVETMGLYNSLYDSVLGQNLAGARTAFDAFSGDFFGTVSNRVASSAQRLQANLLSDAQSTAQGPATWTMVETGADAGFGPQYRSGLSFAGNGFRASLMSGYIPFEVMAASSEGTATMATHYVGGSFSYNDNGWNLQAGVGVANHQVEASRAIAFTGFADGSQSRYNATTSQLFGELSYSFQAGSLSLTPYAKASSMAMGRTQIEEIGGDAALSILSAARALTFAGTGFRTAGSIDLGYGLRLTPQVALGWQWADGDLGTAQESRFRSNGSRFDIIASPVRGDGIDVDAAVELAFGRMSLAAKYRRNAVFREIGDGAHLNFRLVF